jgi:hypothetical protein
MNYKDAVLLTTPSNEAIKIMQTAVRVDGDEFRPLLGERLEKVAKRTGLKGPLYQSGHGGVITAEELSWALRKRYITSDLYGDTVEYSNGVEELLKPKVRYIGTEKGRTTHIWY